MTINFKLNPRAPLDRAKDDMSREWFGYDEKLSDQANYEQNRGIWFLGVQADRERYATFSFEGRVRIVVEIDHIETIPAKDPKERSRRAIVGRVLSAGDEAYDLMFDQEADHHRNPMTYDQDWQLCACGCERKTKRRFVSGHDQRAIHDRIARQWGNTVGFIKWFDAEYGEAPKAS
jgi:hypothetical protein